MNTIVGFAFETGDTSCRFWMEWVVVRSHFRVNHDKHHDKIEEIVSDYEADGDVEFDDQVEDIMNKTGLSWEFMGQSVPASETILMFWL